LSAQQRTEWQALKKEQADEREILQGAWAVLNDECAKTWENYWQLGGEQQNHEK
jgi:hypothetical protein